jgi:hypothetical protein
LASDAYLSPPAQEFLGRLTAENKVLWDDVLDQFIATPENDSTIWWAESGLPDVRATFYHPFVIIWRYSNAEVLAIASIRWGPDAPANDPRFRMRM